MAEITAPARSLLSGKTAWARNLEAPLRDFVRTETGSAAFLLFGAVAALLWANMSGGSYERVWHTTLSITIGGAGVTQDLRHWVNDGLMTLFFFVVGLEARREFDLGELRDRRRLALPFVAGMGGMVAPGPHLPGDQRLGGHRTAAGGRRCRPTRPSRWGCSRSSAAGSPTACAPSSSLPRSSTTSSP